MDVSLLPMPRRNRDALPLLLPCSGETPFCDDGTCALQPCDGPALCGMRPCCGETCCEAGQVCCVVEGGAIGPPTCHDEVRPAGCPWCP